jgi:hypothetical protein
LSPPCIMPLPLTEDLWEYMSSYRKMPSRPALERIASFAAII